MQSLSLFCDNVHICDAICSCLLCCFHVPSETHGVIQPSKLHLQLPNTGEDVILPCSCPGFNYFAYYWYKQKMAQTPEFVTQCFRYTKVCVFADKFENRRFSWKFEQTEHQLNISIVQMSDSATYYCLGIINNRIEFCSGTIVSVNGSGMTINQSESINMQSGDSVTLNCTVHTSDCVGKHSVYWFKDSGETHPAIISNQSGSSEQCHRTNGTETQTCVYTLTMKKLDDSYSATYYCGVISCRDTLIGDGTRLDVKSKLCF